MADENISVNEATVNQEATPSVDELMAQLAAERADKERFKNSLDKTLKEKGEITKQLRAKQTAEEQLAEQQAEAKRLADEEFENMRNELNHYKASSAYKDISDTKTIDSLIEAVSSADHSAIAEIIRIECENAVRKAEAEWLNSRPPVSSGNNATSMSVKDIMAIKDSAERQRLIAENINLFN